MVGHGVLGRLEASVVRPTVATKDGVDGDLWGHVAHALGERSDSPRVGTKGLGKRRRKIIAKRLRWTHVADEVGRRRLSGTVVGVAVEVVGRANEPAEALGERRIKVLHKVLTEWA